MTPLPFKLTYANVIKTGQAAFLNHELQAQQGDRGCTYRNHLNQPCIIGAALPDDVAQILIKRGLNTIDINGLMGLHANQTKDLLQVPTKDLPKLVELQRLHDLVVVVVDATTNEIDPERLEALRAALFDT